MIKGQVKKEKSFGYTYQMMSISIPLEHPYNNKIDRYLLLKVIRSIDQNVVTEHKSFLKVLSSF